MPRKRYVQVGTGGRARFFYEAIARDYRDQAELCAFCDINATRMAYANTVIQGYGHAEVPTYGPPEFDTMVRTHTPDVVIVTSIDRTHHRYINRALQLGCDVITEKPMTVDAAKCQSILNTIAATGRSVRVTFNYRYASIATRVRELVKDETIGQVFSVHFEWLLDTTHGADYFRRWHRDKRNSGGLLVHKSTHHFDLINFWMDSRPETVFAFGDLLFYGRENAEERGVTRFYSRAHNSPAAEDDPFALNLAKSDTHKALYLDAEHEDGYYRDQSVFGHGISIEDTMAVTVRYENRALLTYALHAYSPWEGYRVSLNGECGRIQVLNVADSYVSAGGDGLQEGTSRKKSITVFPLFAAPYDVEIPDAAGGHGGGDPVLLNDLFGDPTPDPLNRAASHVAGAWSILTGIAANTSMRTGQPCRPADLVTFP